MDQRQVAVVTGGNRGMGFETCRQLADQGCRVVLTARSDKEAQRAGAAIGEDVLSYALDVTLAGAAEDFARWLRGNCGRVDILINNAGVFLDATDPAASASVFEVPFDIICRTFETNTLGPLELIRALLPLMKERQYGRIVNVSSGMGQLHDMGGQFPGYRISKVALNAVTRMVAAELTDHDIKINACCPGWVRTDMGGSNADRSVTEGVDCTLWLARLPADGPSGLFFRDRQVIDW